VSGRRRPGRLPLLARHSDRALRKWAAGETEQHRFAACGRDSVVYPPAVIVGHEWIHIGDGVVVLPGAFLSVLDEWEDRRYEPRLVIGDGTRIGFDAVIACVGRVEIGARVLTADRVFIGDTYHRYSDPDRPILDQGLIEPRPVSIGPGAFLGINSVVLPGVTVGEGAYVGAGAVVTRDVPPRTVMVGNPARPVREWDGRAWRRCGEA
jgi:acetyltransferase-like isoleucine patch superfamily enzyme